NESCAGGGPPYCPTELYCEEASGLNRDPNSVCTDDARACQLCANNPFVFHCDYVDSGAGGSGSGPGDPATAAGSGSDTDTIGNPRPPTITGSDTTPTIDTNPTIGIGSDIGATVSSTSESIDNVGHFITTEENGGYYGEFQNHHLLPRQFDADQFEPRGLTIDDYTMKLDSNLHRIIHGKGIGYEESWNYKWGGFFRGNPDATQEDIIAFLYQLMYEYGLL
ncbi:DUF2380 domain-containing protein, partial [Candidatus Bathyarchaeota archaeon]|nr:DUF2380 domain-containing protein [Candidatus Bathyarchaeota archaeon]